MKTESKAQSKYKVGQRVKYSYKCSLYSTVQKGVSEIISIQANFSTSTLCYYLKDDSIVDEDEILGLDLPPHIRSGKLLW